MKEEKQLEKILADIWNLSQGLYSPAVDYSDITKSNYDALIRINQYCAKELNKLKETK